MWGWFSGVLPNASVVLVLLNDEPGAAVVAEVLEGAFVSTVNLSEVVAKLLDAGMRWEEAEDAPVDPRDLY